MSAQKGFSIVIVVVVIGVILATGGFFFFQTTSQKTSVTKPQDLKNQIYFESSDKKLLLSGGFADPSVIKFNNKYIMYVNKFGSGPSANLVYTSTDGVSFNETGNKVPGAPTSRAYVMDGFVRLYYTTQVPINPSDPPSQILSAKSEDGINFTAENGIRVKPSDGYIIEGPSIIKTTSGYNMYFSEFEENKPQERRNGKIFKATSSDGLNWVRDTKPSLQTDQTENASSDWPQVIRPFVLKRPSGGFVMFYNSHSKIFAAYSEDGNSWEKLGSLGLKGADVDGYYLEDGKIRIYFGDFSEKTSGVVYTTTLKETKNKPAVAEEETMGEPVEGVKPLGSKPPPPPGCVGKKETDPNLPQECQMWFKIK